MHERYLKQIIGPINQAASASALNILWVYGYDDHHIPGAHDYVRIKYTMSALLRQIPKIKVEEVFNFPDPEKFKRADLMVMYLHLPQLSDEQIGTLETYIREGGAMVWLHETAILRPASKGKNFPNAWGRPGMKKNQNGGPSLTTFPLTTAIPFLVGLAMKLP